MYYYSRVRAESTTRLDWLNTADDIGADDHTGFATHARENASQYGMLDADSWDARGKGSAPPLFTTHWERHSHRTRRPQLRAKQCLQPYP